MQEERGPRKNKGTKRSSVVSKRSSHLPPSSFLHTPPCTVNPPRHGSFEHGSGPRMTSLGLAGVQPHEMGLPWSHYLSAFRPVPPRSSLLPPMSSFHPWLTWSMPAAFPAMLLGNVGGVVSAADCSGGSTSGKYFGT